MMDVITGDETWVPFYSIARKRRNKAGLGPNDQTPNVPAWSRKRMFTIFFELKHQKPVAADVFLANSTTTGSH